MQILEKSKYGTMQVQYRDSMVCWVSNPRFIDGTYHYIVTGQFQCICGRKWPMATVAIDKYADIEKGIEVAIQSIQALAEKSALCGEHHA